MPVPLNAIQTLSEPCWSQTSMSATFEKATLVFAVRALVPVWARHGQNGGGHNTALSFIGLFFLPIGDRAIGSGQDSRHALNKESILDRAASTYRGAGPRRVRPAKLAG